MAQYRTELVKRLKELAESRGHYFRHDAFNKRDLHFTLRLERGRHDLYVHGNIRSGGTEVYLKLHKLGVEENVNDHCRYFNEKNLFNRYGKRFAGEDFFKLVERVLPTAQGA